MNGFSPLIKIPTIEPENNNIEPQIGKSLIVIMLTINVNKEAKIANIRRITKVGCLLTMNFILNSGLLIKSDSSLDLIFRKLFVLTNVLGEPHIF